MVEFEENYLAAATAVARIKVEKEAQKEAAAKVGEPVEKWNVTDTVQKSEVTNPEEKKKKDKKTSENLSLESLAAAVEDFTPRDLSTC